MIEHHLTDDLLMQYSTGSATEPEALLVASHLVLCPACRARQAVLDAAGGALLAQAEPASVGADLLAATLARLDEPAAPEPEPAYDPDGVLPALWRLAWAGLPTCPGRGSFPGWRKSWWARSPRGSCRRDCIGWRQAASSRHTSIGARSSRWC